MIPAWVALVSMFGSFAWGYAVARMLRPVYWGCPRCRRTDIGDAWALGRHLENCGRTN